MSNTTITNHLSVLRQELIIAIKKRVEERGGIPVVVKETGMSKHRLKEIYQTPERCDLSGLAYVCDCMGVTMQDVQDTNPCVVL